MEAQREPGHAANFLPLLRFHLRGKPSGSGVEGVNASLRARDLLRCGTPGYKNEPTSSERGCQDRAVFSHPRHAVSDPPPVQAHRGDEDGSHRDPLMPTLRPFRYCGYTRPPGEPGQFSPRSTGANSPPCLTLSNLIFQFSTVAYRPPSPPRGNLI